MSKRDKRIRALNGNGEQDVVSWPLTDSEREVFVAHVDARNRLRQNLAVQDGILSELLKIALGARGLNLTDWTLDVASWTIVGKSDG